MRIHKSFIMGYGAKNRKKDLVLEVEPQGEVPEMIIEKQETTAHALSITHYDDGTPVTLEYRPYADAKKVSTVSDDYETYDAVEEVTSDHGGRNAQGHSRSYSAGTIEDAVIFEDQKDDEKEEEHYTIANAYFEDDISKEEETSLFSEAHEIVQKKSQIVQEDIRSETKDMDGKTPTFQDAPEEEAILATHHENEEVENKKFEEDLKAIFEKKKKSDQAKAALDPSEILKNKSKGVGGRPIEEDLQEKMKSNHAIFEQIAQSMDMANTYDFGSIAMNKKFDDLEAETDDDFTQKISDLIEDNDKKDEKKVPSYVNKKDEDKDKVMTEDFLKDLDRLKALSSEKSKIEVEQQDEAEKYKAENQPENSKEQKPKSDKKNAADGIEDAVILPEKKEEYDAKEADDPI